MSTIVTAPTSRGIIFNYEDGGTYCGEWADGHADGYGVCTGPEGRGRFEGLWEKGLQVSGVYTWPNGQKYSGKWEKGEREGVGKETKPDGTEYSGDFTKDSRGPYGVIRLPNGAVYRGSWTNGLQDGEGVETYIDGGVYRGQYKKGLRHGFGTRSSFAYENKDSSRKTSDPNPATKHSFIPKQPTALSLAQKVLKQSETVTNFDGSQKSTLSSTTQSSATTAIITSAPADSNVQTYEGSWKEDKRDGFGMLKVVGHYTYYGEWSSNSRTGYGVLLYDDGHKEEGEWRNGHMKQALNRKKRISIKNHHLESKVKHAYTQAVQAADYARNKAMLAESRSQSAEKKSRAALKVSHQATKDSQQAAIKCELHKNAPRVTEGIKSPAMTYTALDPDIQDLRFSSSVRRDSPATSLLSVTPSGTMKMVPSFENIQSIARDPRGSGAERNSSDSSDSSTGSVDRANYGRASVDNSSFEEGSCRSGSSLSVTESELGQAQQQRLVHKTSSKVSFESAQSSSSLDRGTLDILRQRRKQFQKKGGAESEATFSVSTSPASSPALKRPGIRRSSDSTLIDSHHSPLAGKKSNSLSDHAEIEEEEEEEERGGSVDDMWREGGRSRKISSRMMARNHVDQTTGEIRDHGDVTDDDEDKGGGAKKSPEHTYSSSLPPPPHPLVKKRSVTMDMLTQMANWNKMVAYINFGLLIFLLVLILVVVMTMNYYIISQGPGSSSSSLPVTPPGLMA